MVNMTAVEMCIVPILHMQHHAFAPHPVHNLQKRTIAKPLRFPQFFYYSRLRYLFCFFSCLPKDCQTKEFKLNSLIDGAEKLPAEAFRVQGWVLGGAKEAARGPHCPRS